MPVMLTGPTGCGKTRFVEHMGVLLQRPVVTISCHDDLTSSDLVGRFMVTGGDVVWTDGPLTRAVKAGAICYLDEVVEARHDSLAVLHSLTDHRRSLYLDRAGEVVKAPDTFMLVCSYNPAYRSSLKELKPSFRQRFVTLSMTYLPPDREAEVIVAEAGIPLATAQRLVGCAVAIRTADQAFHFEPPSTRVLVTAAQLIAAGATELDAADACILAPLSTDGAVTDGLREVAAASLADLALERSIRHGSTGAEAQESAHRLPDRHLRLSVGDVRNPALYVIRPGVVGPVNLPLLNRLSGNGTVSLEDHHDESRLAQRRADKWMIVGAALMGMWAPGLIGFPIFMRGVWLQRQALRAGLSVRPMIVTLIGYLVLIDGMLNSLGWALDLVANHTLINRVLMVGWGNMFDAGYFWHYNELWVGGAAGPGEKAYVAGLILTVFSMRVAAAIGFLQMKRWGHQWMVVTCWMGVVIWSAYVFNMTMYADVRYAGVVFPVVGWWLYDIFYITPFLAIPYLHTVNREIFSD